MFLIFNKRGPPRKMRKLSYRPIATQLQSCWELPSMVYAIP